MNRTNRWKRFLPRLLWRVSPEMLLFALAMLLVAIYQILTQLELESFAR